MSETKERHRTTIEALLAGAGPASGFELLRRLGSTATEFERGLYPTLHRLEADGRVTARWEATPAGIRRRYMRSRRVLLIPTRH